MPRCLLALALCTWTLPAQAQWVAVGRWGQPDNFRFVPPGTWMVETSADSVTISAEGDNHVGRIALTCSATDPDGELDFSLYHGAALGHDPAIPSKLTLDLDGSEFQVEVTYSEPTRSWVADTVLDTALLDAFAWGTQLTLTTSDGTPVTRYRLEGSGAARQAIRRACGI